jgi:hypothetical protein
MCIKALLGGLASDQLMITRIVRIYDKHGNCSQECRISYQGSQNSEEADYDRSSFHNVSLDGNCDRPGVSAITAAYNRR